MPRKLVVCALEKFCATKCVSFRLQPAFVWPSVQSGLVLFCPLVLRCCAIASRLSLVPVLWSRPERFHRKFRKPFIEEVGSKALLVREGCQ
jgi:hypothetical protein